MSNSRRIIAALVVAVVLGPIGGLAISVPGALAKTCQTADGSYDVTPPPAGSREGVDPAELAAVNCAPVFREDTTYPLSVIGLALLATVGTLVLVRRGPSYDAIGGEA